MEFLGIGPLELVLIIILAMVLIGPRDMAKVGRDAGRFLNRVYRSPTWRTMNEASRELRNLPNRLAREAELDTLQRDLDQVGRGLQDDVKAAGDGMQAWMPPLHSTTPPPIPAQAPTPKAPEGPPVEAASGPPPPSESPFAEG
jgi:sec-independent protein translocase protein TatB